MIQKPLWAYIDGIRLDTFVPPNVYEVGNSLAALFLAEGWAVPIDDVDVGVVVPAHDFEPDYSSLPPNASLPPNLIRDIYPPYIDDPPATAVDRRRRKRRKHQP